MYTSSYYGKTQNRCAVVRNHFLMLKFTMFTQIGIVRAITITLFMKRSNDCSMPFSFDAVSFVHEEGDRMIAIRCHFVFAILTTGVTSFSKQGTQLSVFCIFPFIQLRFYVGKRPKGRSWKIGRKMAPACLFVGCLLWWRTGKGT